MHDRSRLSRLLPTSSSQKARSMLPASPRATLSVLSALGFLVTALIAPVPAEAEASRSTTALPAVPREPARTDLTLVTTLRSGVLAWTGTGTNARAGTFPDRAAAERAGLTPFVFEPSAGGYGRFRIDDGAEDPRCLGLQRTVSGALAVVADLVACDDAAGNWTIEAGSLQSAAGPYATHDLVLGPDGVGTGASWNASDAADFRIEVERRPAVPAAVFDVAPPTFNRPESRATVSGTATADAEVTIVDTRGASLVEGVVRAGGDGRWSADLVAPTNGDPNVRFLVSVAEGPALSARAWGTVSYGVGLSLDGPTAWVADDGSVRVTGHGDPAADVVVVETGDGVRVRQDGSFTLDFRPRGGSTTLGSVELAMRGFGGFQTRVPVRVERAPLDVVPVFPADPSQPAYLEGYGVPGATVTATDTNGRTIGSADVGDDGRVDLKIEAPDASGVHEVALRQELDGRDLAERTVRVDFGAAVRITSPTEGGLVSDDTVVRGTGEPGAELTTALDGRVLHTVVGADGSWSGTLADPRSLPFRLVTPTGPLRYSDRSKPALSGTGTPGSDVFFVSSTSEPSHTARTTVRPDGSWRFSGDEIGILQDETWTDASVSLGTGANRPTIRIPALTGDQRPLTVREQESDAPLVPTAGAVVLHGTGTPGDVIRTTAPDAHEYRTVVHADGSWSLRGVRLASGAHTLRIAGRSDEVTARFTVASGVGSSLSILTPLTAAVAVPDAGFESPTVRVTGIARSGIGALTDRQGSGRTVGFVVDRFGGWKRTLRLDAPGQSDVRAATPTDAPVGVRFTTDGEPAV